MARDSFSSSIRSTTTVPSFRETLALGWCSSESLPLGPSKEMVRPLMATLTVLGSGTGFLPMRLMILVLVYRLVTSAFAGLPVVETMFRSTDRGEQLAADVLLPRLAIR